MRGAAAEHGRELEDQSTSEKSCVEEQKYKLIDLSRENKQYESKCTESNRNVKEMENRLMKEMRANKEKDDAENNNREVLHLEIQYPKNHLKASKEEVAEREGERERERNRF